MYFVEWVPKAVSDLAEFWADADSSVRARLTSAVNCIDRALERNPQDAGESRNDERRILIESPLGVIYRIREDLKVVTISHVWHFATRD